MDQPVYHYYNRKYSETGLISDDIDKIFQILAKDFADGRTMRKNIEKALEETGSFECFNACIRKTTLKGSPEDYWGRLFVLRYPFGIYVKEEEARYDGLKWVKESTKTSKLSDLESFKDDNEALEKL